MSADIYEYRDDVLATLNRMASAEARLSREADARGDEQEGARREHGETCLREAVAAIRRLGRE